MMSNGAYGIKFESDDSACGSAEGNPSHYDAAEAAVANLGSIVAGQNGGPPSLKRKPEAPPSAAAVGSADAGSECKKKKPLTNERREERNMREKERSLKITQQIHELRELLSMGGIIVPKGTKSTILTEAANYIRLLQQHQYRSEMDKAQLVQEVQRIGNGAIGEKAAYAIRHAASQNGVSSMANLPEAGSVPDAGAADPQHEGNPADPLTDSIGEREYRCVFNSCSVGMAIATMGGSFIDCNLAFTQLASYTKPELKAMTIFNITSREDLQGAFDMMSQLITPATGGLDADGNASIGSDGNGGATQSPVILKSAIRHRSDLGLSVSLIRADDGVARYFSVTLVKLPPSPLGLGEDALKPVPTTAEMSPEVQDQGQQNSQKMLLHQQQRVGLPGVMGAAGMPMQMHQQLDAANKPSFPGMNTPQYTAG